MATVLASGSNQLVVALFGQRIAFTKAQGGGVACQAGAITEDPAAMKTVFSDALTWFDTSAPRETIELGPFFGQTFKFFDQLGQPSCYAVHGTTLGVRESPRDMVRVLTIAKTWLTEAGV